MSKTSAETVPAVDQTDQGGSLLHMIAHHHPNRGVARNPGILQQGLHAPGDRRDVGGAPPAPATLHEIAVRRRRDEIVQAIDEFGRPDLFAHPSAAALRRRHRALYEAHANDIHRQPSANPGPPIVLLGSRTSRRDVGHLLSRLLFRPFLKQGPDVVAQCICRSTVRQQSLGFPPLHHQIFSPSSPTSHEAT